MALRLWQDQPGSRLLAGSNRQQTVGRINQVADRGDGEEDEDEDELFNNEGVCRTATAITCQLNYKP